MKKIFMPVTGIMLFALSSVASAIPIATVGSADDLVAWASLSNSGSATEKQFVADYLNVDASSIAYTQLSGSGGSAWLTVDEDPSLSAFDFGGLTPDLFLVKTGAGVGLPGESGTFDTYLFENLSSLFYGVIDLDLFTRTHGNIEIGMVSHVGVSGTAVNVPEPSTLGLLALGLAGLGLVSRRRVKSCALRPATK